MSVVDHKFTTNCLEQAKSNTKKDASNDQSLGLLRRKKLLIDQTQNFSNTIFCLNTSACKKLLPLKG